MAAKKNASGAKKTGGPGSVGKGADGEQTPVSRPLTPPESPRISMRRDVPPINTDMGGESSGQGERSGGSTSSGLHPDAHIDRLLKTSQDTLQSLGETFRIVANQTLTLTTLGPALGAVKKIECLEAEVKSHGEVQRTSIEKARGDVARNVEHQIEKVLRPRVSEMVAAAIEEVIGQHVQVALEKQVQKEEKEAIERYRTRILEVKILLTNAEARRSNEQCRREFSAEPLRPLLRPIGTSSPDAAATAAAAPDNAPKGKGKKTAQQSAGSGAGDRSAAAAGQPSPLFPKHVVELSRMSARDARQLVIEYGLPVGEGKERWEDWEDLGETDGKGAGTSKGNKQNGTAGGGGQGSDKKGAKAKEAQEKEEKERKEREEKLVAREQARREDLNAFMKFIGFFYTTPVLHSSRRCHSQRSFVGTCGCRWARWCCSLGTPCVRRWVTARTLVCVWAFRDSHDDRVRVVSPKPARTFRGSPVVAEGRGWGQWCCSHSVLSDCRAIECVPAVVSC